MLSKRFAISKRYEYIHAELDGVSERIRDVCTLLLMVSSIFTAKRIPLIFSDSRFALLLLIFRYASRGTYHASNSCREARSFVALDSSCTA